MRRILPSSVEPGHVDYDVCTAVANEITIRAGGADNLRREMPILIRRAIDEVIDTPRTGRLVFAELEKTEKTYIGTKVEILLRDLLGLPKGRLDLEIKGQDVDIKNTTGNNWMIPTEAVDHPCILVASDENSFLCYLGVIVARLDYLTAGKNKDSKRSVSAAGFKNIFWLLCEEPYPPNFWAGIDRATAEHITDMTVGGTERLRRLFRNVLEVPVSRDVVQGIARQHDYMKRIRKNGGARDPLLKEGIAILSGAYYANAIEELGLPPCDASQFMAVAIDSEDRRKLLDRHGYFDY